MAAEMAGIDRGRHYDWLKADPEYRAEFEKVQDQAVQALEDEAVRRAYHGIEKPITVAGKREIIREYSDTILIFLLKGARPQKYRDNVRQEVTGADGVPLGPRKVKIVIVPTPQATGMTGSQEMRLHPERGHRATVESGNRIVGP